MRGAPLPREQQYDLGLQRVRVLELVDQQELEALPEVFACTGRLHQQIAGANEEVFERERALAPPPLRVVDDETIGDRDQLCQRLGSHRLGVLLMLLLEGAPRFILAQACLAAASARAGWRDLELRERRFKRGRCQPFEAVQLVEELPGLRTFSLFARRGNQILQLAPQRVVHRGGGGGRRDRLAWVEVARLGDPVREIAQRVERHAQPQATFHPRTCLGIPLGPEPVLPGLLERQLLPHGIQHPGSADPSAPPAGARATGSMRRRGSSRCAPRRLDRARGAGIPPPRRQPHATSCTARAGHGPVAPQPPSP